MPNQSLYQRLDAAIKAFRVQFSGANPAGGWQGGSGVIPIDDGFTLAQAIRAYRSTINYAKEIGDISQSSLVMAAVNWVGRTLPEAPFRVVEETAAGMDEPIAKHPAAKLLRRPNLDYSGATLMKASALSWILSGNIYWLKQRGVRNAPVRLYWWPHWQIRPIRAVKGDYISYYEVAVDGIWSRVDRDDVIHFRDGIDPNNDMQGLSPLLSLLREVYTDGEVTDYQAAITKNGGVIPFVLSPKGNDVETDTARIKDEVMRRITGDERGKPLVLTSGVELIKMGITPAEMAIDQVRHVPEERVAAVIGIPGMVLGFGSALQRSTFSNYTQAQEAAYETYMVPLWRYMDDELTSQLLIDFEKPDSPRRIEHDLSGVRALQEDEDAKHKRVTLDYQQNVITRAEARAALGLEVDEKRDNVFLMRSGVVEVPADMAERERQKQEAEKMQAQIAGQAGKQLPSEYKDAGWHSFSSVMAVLPEDVAGKMIAFGATIAPQNLTLDKGLEGEPHITLKYGLHTQVESDVRAVVTGNGPVEIEFGKTDYFQADEFDVVYVAVKSRGLKALNKKLSGALEHTTTHDHYTPHATIAYVNPGHGAEYAGRDFLAGTRIEIDSLIFASADGARTPIPLPAPLSRAADAR